MLSAAERKFLTEGTTGNPKHDAVMRFRIRRKLMRFQCDLSTLTHNGLGAQFLDVLMRIITDFRNQSGHLTKNCNFENGPKNASFVVKEAPGKGFEPLRPKGSHALQACALPG